MNTEAREVAGSIVEAMAIVGESLPSTMDEARAIVRATMPDESMTVIDNTAEALLRDARRLTDHGQGW